MDPEQLQLFEELTETRRQARVSAAREGARRRCLARDDVETVVIREDGTLLCTDYNGVETLRLGGWRGRT